MASNDAEDSKPLFQDLDEEQAVSELGSLCFNCHEQGVTRLMLTKIPYFKEVILSSFSCDSCGYSDTEVQFGGRIQEKGHRLTVTISDVKDLDRQLVKSDWATVSIPKLDFEQPPTKKGEITTVEGLLDRMTESILAMQPVRKIQDPETATKLDIFLEKVAKLKELTEPFELILDDPSGNSHIENPSAPAADPALKVSKYVRTREHDIALGLVAEDQEQDDTPAEEDNEENEEDAFKPGEESLGFPDNCPNCNSPCMVRMKVTDIPFFKQVVLMATNCDHCGLRESEVKGGAGIEPKGTRICLKVTSPRDLTRDLLKSDTCGVQIPEFELELQDGTLGGKFTTIEGLLTNIKDQLRENTPFTSGDSTPAETKKRLDAFIEKLESAIDGKTLDYRLILDDPAGNSYLQNLHAPDDDPELVIEYYQRSYEQNDRLGLNDMKTENYEEDS